MKRTIVALLCLALGCGDGGRNDAWVAEVDGVRIPAAELRRLVEQRRTTKTGETLVINSWDVDGGIEIRNGAGARIEYDGELGTPHRVYYRGGKRVSPR